MEVSYELGILSVTKEALFFGYFCVIQEQTNLDILQTDLEI